MVDASQKTGTVSFAYPLVEQTVADIITDLKTTDRSYFGKDRTKVIKGKIDEAVVLLDSKPIDLGK